MKYPILCTLCCIAAITAGMLGQTAPPQPPKSALELTDAEKTKQELLQTKFQLMQAQIREAVQEHQAEVNKFVTDTLKAHGDPKDVEWDPVTYTFVKKKPIPPVAEPGPGAPAPKH